MDRDTFGLSSMATRLILAELSEQIRLAHGIPVRFESAGGVKIAQRVRQGAEADVLVLADGALAELAAEGHLLGDTVRPLWVSQVVAAMPEGTPVPALRSESDLRAALLSAMKIAYSTGPSGTALLDLITRLDLADTLRDRLVQAPPGVPAGSLLASGEADLAFQQQSELMDLPGVVIVGPLPGDTEITSTFSGGVLAASTQPGRAREVLDLLASDAASKTARARGMRAPWDQS
ncbi:substrate-binding domain-containing protein [Streptomyces antarcticus]|uniref:substrate-binding domain-containing protein n=1 Tax=Streptomyces antarcticus TaxID=2996458 RepID=UPI00227042A1|nr:MULTISPECIES: substrate-binding domain-containing protein [unclassified Streptomyces]MCY0942063.1 substrate-binding domain-containing protein [Streptomyces sp. H34-AA3]MCZ4081919.1 substrate-binding domain-containing protein [Streptomyces sp. H34-S5]